MQSAHYGGSILWACAVAASCRGQHPADVAAVDPIVPLAAAAPALIASVSGVDAGAPSPIAGSSPAVSPLAAWLGERLPRGGRVVADDAGAPLVVHTITRGDTAQSIAKEYLGLTDVYRAKELAADIGKTYAVLPSEGQITVPHILAEIPPSADEGRLAWPSDGALKGVFISGVFAGQFWPETIEKLASHGLNAVVLDAKDYMGPINYPTKVKLAIETGAANEPPIADFARAIRFAHARGIRVIARIPCFHDPYTAKHAPRLSLMATSGRPFEMGWIDPANPEVQEYVLDLVRESIDLGADEVQLDYIRFPVQSVGLKNAVMPAPDGHRTQTIDHFLVRVHDVTRARRIPLSLDVFGVTATGALSDIEALGQNLGVIGTEAEALSPMVYPSHYAAGWNGFAEPGNHPEIIGIGTKAAIARLADGRVAKTIVRPWLQASSYKATAYGPQYIRDEIKSAESSGAVGWLMWDPGNSYWAVWQALPIVKADGDARVVTAAALH